MPHDKERNRTRQNKIIHPEATVTTRSIENSPPQPATSLLVRVSTSVEELERLPRPFKPQVLGAG
jgi:hypothetical protein